MVSQDIPNEDYVEEKGKIKKANSEELRIPFRKGGERRLLGKPAGAAIVFAGLCIFLGSAFYSGRAEEAGDYIKGIYNDMKESIIERLNKKDPRDIDSRIFWNYEPARKGWTVTDYCLNSGLPGDAEVINTCEAKMSGRNGFDLDGRENLQVLHYRE